MLLLSCLFNATAVGAYNFPEPDWGKLLNERKAMVNTSEIELYVEGDVDSAPYYGAKFEPRGGTYIGMIADTSDDFQPLGSYLTYIDSMYQGDLYYPSNDMIRRDPVVAMVGWTVNSLGEVNYDAIRTTLNRLNSYGKPMFIRFANEMNVSALGDEPNEYIQIFKNVANMVHEYDNLAVVWSPNDLGSLDRPFEYYYPGDEYVDWVGVSCYSIKYFMGQKNTLERDQYFFMTGDYSWPTNRVKPVIEFMEKYNIRKPIMLSECGVSTSNNFGEDLESWAAPRLKNLLYFLAMKYPQIKMINYFNVRRDWEKQKYDISAHPYASDIFKQASRSGAYITSYGSEPEFVFQKATESSKTLVAEGDIINLYTYLYQPGPGSEENVNFFLDNVWYRGSNQMPYICDMNVSEITNGEHTLTVKANGMSKTYTFYKWGQCIRFDAYPDSAVVDEAEAKKNQIKVEVNGAKISFDQDPIIIDGYTLVPMRNIFAKLGAEVSWDAENRKVTAYKGGSTIEIPVDCNYYYVNGELKWLDVPSQIINGRTLVPLRAVAEALGCSVYYHADRKLVTITQ